MAEKIKMANKIAVYANLKIQFHISNQSFVKYKALQQKCWKRYIVSRQLQLQFCDIIANAMDDPVASMQLQQNILSILFWKYKAFYVACLNAHDLAGSSEAKVGASRWLHEVKHRAVVGHEALKEGGAFFWLANWANYIR